MNKVMFIGRLTKDVEVKRLNGGDKSVASFKLAVTRNFTNSNGEKQVDFIPVVAWDKNAEMLEKYTEKGNRVCVIGRLQIRDYETNEGEKRSVTEVIAQEIQFLDFKAKNEETAKAI